MEIFDGLNAPLIEEPRDPNDAAAADRQHSGSFGLPGGVLALLRQQQETAPAAPSGPEGDDQPRAAAAASVNELRGLQTVWSCGPSKPVVQLLPEFQLLHMHASVNWQQTHSRAAVPGSTAFLSARSTL
eukprot:gene5723-5963_t